MSSRLIVVVGLLFAGALLWPAERPSPSELTQSPKPDETIESPPALPECGCAAAEVASSKPTEEQFESLLAQFATEPMSEQSHALEALLFHGLATQGYLDGQSAVGLDPQRLSFLRRELRRTHALVAVRVIDQAGVLRAGLEPTSIPFGVKQHLHARDTSELQPPEISLTVKRVGLHHLWTRV
jgi:hypothetical protein